MKGEYAGRIFVIAHERVTRTMPLIISATTIQRPEMRHSRGLRVAGSSCPIDRLELVGGSVGMQPHYSAPG